MLADWSLNCKVIVLACVTERPAGRAGQIGKLCQTHCLTAQAWLFAMFGTQQDKGMRGEAAAAHVSRARESDLVRGALHMLSLILNRNAAGAGKNWQIGCSQLSVTSRSHVPICIQRTC